MEYESSDYRGIAFDKLRGKWRLALLITLVAVILGGSNGYLELYLNVSLREELFRKPLEYFSQFSPFLLAVSAYTENTILTILIVYAVIALFVGAFVQLGHNMFYINLCNNKSVSFSMLFSRVNIFWRALGLRLYMMLFIVLWSAFLFIPGIIAAYRYALAPFLLAQNPKMSSVDAVCESKELMRGHVWRLFCLDLSFFGWWLLSLLTLGIGFLWLGPYRHAARAAFYLDRTGQGELLNTPELS